jgi:hypothetical protein
MIALESVMGLWFLRRAVPWPDLLRIAGVALLTYAHWFWWHFHLGVKTGASRRQSCHLWPKGGGAEICALSPAARDSRLRKRQCSAVKTGARAPGSFGVMLQSG